jgi:hypothetical protein
MSLAVVDSGGANIASVLHALGRLGVEPEFTSDAGRIRSADRVILPGVGAAGRAMEVLREHGLVEVIRDLTQPVLGICLGMQLLFESSEEDEAQLLGLIPARLERIPEAEGLRVPHMGWNSNPTPSATFWTNPGFTSCIPTLRPWVPGPWPAAATASPSAPWSGRAIFTAHSFTPSVRPPRGRACCRISSTPDHGLHPDIR